MANEKAMQAGCDEAIFHRGERVTECSHSNVHIIKDGTLYTAPCDELILPGITRAHILNICKQEGIPVVEEPFTCRIGEIDGKKVGCKDEKTFARIRDGYQREMKKEAGI